MEQQLEIQSKGFLDTTELIEAIIMHQDGTQDAVLQLRLQAPVYLLREPDNPVHDNAIKVEDEYGNFLGYLMWELADFVAQYMDEKKCPLYGEVIELTTESSQHSVRLKICFNLPSSWCATHPYPDHRYFQNIDYYFWHDPIRGNVKIFINCSERIFNRIRAKFFESGFEVSEKYSGLSLRQPLWKPPYQWALHFRENAQIKEEDIKTFFEKEFNILSFHDRIKTLTEQYKQELSELFSLSHQSDQDYQQKITQLERTTYEIIEQYEDEKLELERKNWQLNSKVEQFQQNLSEKQQGNTDKNIVGIVSNSEVDLYQDERKDLIIEILQNALNAIPDNQKHSRRSDILRDILSVNQLSGEKQYLLDDLQKLLRNYREMDAKTESAFRELGFEVFGAGKEYKLIFGGDKRYSVTISRTSGDYNVGDNLFSHAFKRKLF